MYPSSDRNLSYETDEAIYFFSHAFDPLNNWSAHAINIWGKRFPSVEHAYHYRKFSDALPEVAQAILDAPSPRAAMQVERRHKKRRRADWEDVKQGIMEEIVRAKVAQHDDVRTCLLATDDKKIIENSPWDAFWGCGPDGAGNNAMGKIYMQIRKNLKEDKNEAN